MTCSADISTPDQPLLVRFMDRYPLLVSLVINAVLFLAVYLFFTPYYQTNDDVLMMMKLSGYGIVPEPTVHVIYSNIFLAYPLKFLYGVNNGLPWYGGYLVLSLFVSHVVLLLILIKRFHSITSLLMYLVYFVFFVVEIIVSLQFTAVAGLCVGSGLLLMSFSEARNLRSRGMLYGGALLVLFGAMIRWESFQIMVLLSIPLWIWLFFKNPWAIYRTKVVTMVLTGVVAFVLTEVSTRNYEAYDPGWIDFHWNCSELLDYQILRKLDSKEKEEILSEVGWSKNDNYMMGTWFYMDENVYNEERVKKIIDYVNKNGAMMSLADNYYQWRKIAMIPFTIRFGIFALVFLGLMPFRWSDIWLLIGTWSMFFLLTEIMMLFYKRPDPRFYFPMLIFCALLQICIGFPELKQIKLKVTLLFLTTIVVGYFGFRQYRTDTRAVVNGNREWREAVQAMHPMKETLYFSWLGVPFDKVLPFENVSYLESINLFSLGDNQRNRDSRAMLDKFEVKNVYHSFYGAGKGQLIISKGYPWLEENYRIFMQEHYHLYLESELLYENNQFLVYRFYEPGKN